MPYPNGTGLVGGEKRWFFVTPFFGFLYMLACIVIGLSYIAVQWTANKAASDGLFVGLLLGATLLLWQGMRVIYKYFRTNILPFFAFALEKKDYEKIPQLAEEYRQDIFPKRQMVLAGVCYGSAVASAVVILNVWEGELLLKGLLFMFLFVINFATGIAFYGMIKFFIASWKLSAYVRVDLWQRENPTTLFFMSIKKRMALLATIYITMSVSSILFSKLSEEPLSLGYSIFAGAIIVLVFVLPEVPIRKKLLIARNRALSTVNVQLQNEFQNVLGDAKSDNPPLDLAKIEKLISLKEKIEKVSVWPFGMQTIVTTCSVILITGLPVILEFLLTHID